MLFTFHFDSSKTTSSGNYSKLASRFTFHFDSIKTVLPTRIGLPSLPFTFHFDSIKTNLPLTDIGNIIGIYISL